jgi:tetratricopeptide (TPR) repeat protein
MSIRLYKRVQISVFLTVFLSLNTSCQNISKTTNSIKGTTSANMVTNSCAEQLSRARNFRFAGKVQEAIDEYQKSIKIGCNEIEIHRELAEMYHGLRNFDKTIEEYQLLLKIDNKDLRGHWALASVLILDKKDFENGINEAVLVQKMMDENDIFGKREIDRLLGKAYDGLGDSDNAKKYFSKFLKGCSETPDSKDCKEIKNRIMELKK